jgi:MYXO-CTERM domain-containing protein
MFSSGLLAPAFGLLPLLLGPSYGFSSQTEQDGTAWLELNTDEPAKGVEVIILGDDGTEVRKTVSLRPGKPYRIKWKQKGGEVTYKLEIKAGDAYVDAEFDVQKIRVAGEPTLKFVASRDDLVYGRTAKYKTGFAISEQHLVVHNTDGDEIHNERFQGVHEPGDTFEVNWRSDDEVFSVKMRATDDAGRYAEDLTVPWSIGIPHTDVIFDSGKWDINDSEKPKLDDAFAIIVHELVALEKANQTVGANLAAQIYIVGHTDTVGKPGKNMTLSENRARAISQYFIDKGLWCEVYFAGMGERGLAVKTDDNVDEARNRRAQYVLGVQKPAPGGDMPGTGQWKKLQGQGARMIQKLPELPDSYLAYKEKMDQERRAKMAPGGDSSGGGDSSSGSGGSSGSGSSSSDSGDMGSGGGDSSYDGGSSDASGGGDDGAPPAIGDTPGSKKGCSVGDEAPAGWLGGLMLLAMVGRRRRD